MTCLPSRGSKATRSPPEGMRSNLSVGRGFPWVLAQSRPALEDRVNLWKVEHTHDNRQEALGDPHTLFIRDLSSEGPPSPLAMFSSFLVPSSLYYRLLSPQEQPVFLCLPGLFRLGLSLFVGPSLSPTRQMPGLDCVFPELPT